MENRTIYLKLDQNIEVTNAQIFLKDLGNISCTDEKLNAKIKGIKVFRFRNEKENRIVISSLKIIDLIVKEFPGVSVENIGESDVVVEWIAEKKKNIVVEKLKILAVCLLTFFGTAFTIMAFHNDIGIRDLFNGIHEMITGTESNGHSILEFSYSIGLCIGIIVFFNHIGGKRITKDPTPMEMEMKKYNQDLIMTKIADSDEKGHTIDVS